jgi:hypothetical protein
MMSTADNAKPVPVQNGVFAGFARVRGWLGAARMAQVGIFCRNFTGG